MNFDKEFGFFFFFWGGGGGGGGGVGEIDRCVCVCGGGVIRSDLIASRRRSNRKKKPQ